MAKGKAKRATCEECFFQQNMLCALNLDEPCTTFRPAERNLAPERQLAFTFRAERTRAARTPSRSPTELQPRRRPSDRGGGGVESDACA